MPNSFPILLIDDDPEVANILIRAARNTFAEASFICVNSFEDAKSYLNNFTGKGPKLVLLDIDLRDKVDGLDFLALMRADSRGRTLPVVILSSHKTVTLIEKAYSFGAASFTIKPFSFNDWKAYLANLRAYWYNTVTLLNIEDYSS